MTNVLVNMLGLPAIAPASIATCPVCVPVARPVGLSETIVESLGGAVPEPFERVAHSVSEVAVQFSVPPPALETPIAKVFGAVLPTNAVSVRALGGTANCGGGVSVNVTVIWAGLPVAPADITVTCPVCVPVASPAGLSVTVIEAGAVPLL